MIHSLLALTIILAVSIFIAVLLNIGIAISLFIVLEKIAMVIALAYGEYYMLCKYDFRMSILIVAVIVIVLFSIVLLGFSGKSNWIAHILGYVCIETELVLCAYIILVKAYPIFDITKFIALMVFSR